MTKKGKALLAVALSWAILAPASAAVTIDFNGVADAYNLSSYTEDGFVLTPRYESALATPYTYLQPPPSELTTGTLLNYAGPGDLSGFELTSLDQQPFYLFSFALGGYYSTPITQLDVTGIRADGSAVTWQLDQPDVSYSKVYVLPKTDMRWRDLVSVTFTAHGLHNRAVYDNIVILSSPVPEPSTFLSMVLGCVGLAFAVTGARKRSAG